MRSAVDLGVARPRHGAAEQGWAAWRSSPCASSHALLPVAVRTAASRHARYTVLACEGGSGGTERGRVAVARPLLSNVPLRLTAPPPSSGRCPLAWVVCMGAGCSRGFHCGLCAGASTVRRPAPSLDADARTLTRSMPTPCAVCLSLIPHFAKLCVPQAHMLCSVLVQDMKCP